MFILVSHGIGIAWVVGALGASLGNHLRLVPSLWSREGGEHYLTDRELSERLKISRRTLQDYRNNGILPYRQLGGKILYRESDIERVLQNCYRGKF